MIPGTQGYEDIAARLIEQYEAGSFEEKHGPEMHFLRRRPCAVLDIGAGTGADAAWFARQGHRVVAVEPTSGLRKAAVVLHQGLGIDWVDDALPSLKVVRACNMRFDLLVLFAVWMHLDHAERETGMATLAALLAPKGLVVMTLRHGAVPPGRRMSEVTADETIKLAEAHGFTCIFNQRTESFQPLNRAAGVTWTRLAFR